MIFKKLSKNAPESNEFLPKTKIVPIFSIHHSFSVSKVRNMQDLQEKIAIENALPLKEAGRLIRNFQQFNTDIHRFQRDNEIFLKHISNAENLEDHTTTLFCMDRTNPPENRHGLLHYKNKWSLSVRWSETLTDDYDFLLTRHRKKIEQSRNNLQPEKIRLKLNTYNFYSSQDIQYSNAVQQILELHKKYLQLQKIIQSADLWLQSGLNAAIICSNPDCTKHRSPTILDNKTLGLLIKRHKTLFAINQKLHCKACGKRNPIMMPVNPK